MANIQGIIKKILWRDTQTGYSILSFAPAARDEHCMDKGTIICKGKFPLFYRAGIPLCLEGEWKEGGKGETFKVTNFSLSEFSKEQGISFVCSYGISEAHATTLISWCGGNVYKIPKFSSTRLLNIGDGLNALIADIEKIHEERVLADYLTKISCSTDISMKIAKKYGKDATKMLIENPYELGEEFFIPLPICDTIAEKSFGSRYTRKRASAHLVRAARGLLNSGSCFEELDTLVQKAEQTYNNETYSFGSSTRIMALAESKYKLVVDRAGGKEVVYLKDIYDAECKLAEEVVRLLKGAVKLPLVAPQIEVVEAENKNMTFAPEQKKAFTLLSRTGISILTGGAGVGKTTTVNALIRAYTLAYPTNKIALCAPTGRAARRMAELTNLPATTIHRLLEYKIDDMGENFKNASNPIDADLIICDEASMLDMPLTEKLLSAIKTGSLILFVGDSCQLQAVGVGNVLSDLICTGRIPVVELTKVFRQAQESYIISNSHAIKAGETSLKEGEDFRVITVGQGENLTDRVVEELKTCYNVSDPYYAQVLAPVKQGDGGVHEINAKFQTYINPNRDGLTYGGVTYKLADKVILLRNNVVKDYYNGDIGVITEVDTNRNSLTINLGGEKTIVLEGGQLSDVMLAYNMTIHKSQGSQFPVTIVSLPKSGGLLTRNLLYTAVTRAESKVIIVQEEGAIARGCKTQTTGKRKTNLISRITRAMN